MRQAKDTRESWPMNFAIELDDGRVDVIVQPQLGVDVQAVIDTIQNSRLDVQIVRRSPSLLMVNASVEGLKTLSGMDEVLFVSRPKKPVMSAIVSEGVDLIGVPFIDTSQAAGAGTRVAIIDGGFELLSSAILNGELPGTGVRVDITGFGIEIDGKHGTACAEIIHDIVPDALLYYLRVDNTLDFENAVRYVIENRIHVVSQSLSWPGSGAGDGTGPVNRLVDEAEANGNFFG